MTLSLLKKASLALAAVWARTDDAGASISTPAIVKLAKRMDEIIGALQMSTRMQASSFCQITRSPESCKSGLHENFSWNASRIALQLDVLNPFKAIDFIEQLHRRDFAFEADLVRQVDRRPLPRRRRTEKLCLLAMF